MISARLASVFGGLLSIILLLGLGGPGAALAGVPAGNVALVAGSGGASETLILHKLEQPDNMGLPAPGLPLDAASLEDMKPISGVAFEVKRVPVADPTSKAGEVQVPSLTPAEAALLVAGEPVAASGVTDADGVLPLAGLDTGLYYVTETAVPGGVKPGAPFLVSLPMRHPTENTWLHTVHIYPKSARVGITLDVRDQDALTCGDTVTWTARADIPLDTPISSYLVRNVLASGVSLAGDAATITVVIDEADAPALVAGIDYTIVEFGSDVRARTGGEAVDGERGFDVVLTETGRAKLDQYPGGQVRVSYPTRITGPGEHINEARLFVDEAAPAVDTAVTKFGPLNVWIHEKGNEANPVPGTTFRLYLTAEDALAGKNWITVGGISEWTSGPDGTFSIGCLRFTGHVNGLDRDPNDPLYRPYIVGPVRYLAGWSGDGIAISGVVSSATHPMRLVFDAWRGASPSPSPSTPTTELPITNPTTPGGPARPTTPGRQLPVTGAQVGGISLLAVTLIGIGVVLVRRRVAEGHEA
ncbi:MAG: SpaH/EbpB family LPXTG-anchored major pilin [Ancrocorticia sp.]